MPRFLIPLCLVTPFVELYLLFLIGRQVGVMPVLAFILVSAVLGALVAKREGMRVLRDAQASLFLRRVPERGIISGALAFLGGVLLMLPGVVTDGVGLLLLLPPTRRWVAGRIRRHMERELRDGRLHVVSMSNMDTYESDVPEAEETPEWPAPRPHLKGEVDAEFTEEGPGR